MAYKQLSWWDRIERRDVTDWSLSVVTLCVLIESILVPPLAEMGLIHRAAAEAIFVSVIALGAWLLFDRSAVAKLFVCTAVVSIVFRLLPIFAPDLHMPRTDATIAAINLALMFTLVLIYTLVPGEITIHRVMGAIGGYMLLGLVFTQLHRLAGMQFDKAYLVLGSPASWEQIEPQLNYFSFVTLTTLGYGDITPAHPMARALSMLQSLLGVLYPTAFLGWLVSRARPDADHRD
jgi:hypothetical protein